MNTNLYISDIQTFDNGYVRIVLNNKECYYFRNIALFNAAIQHNFRVVSEESSRMQIIRYADFIIDLSNNTVLKNRSFDLKDLFDSEIRKL